MCPDLSPPFLTHHCPQAFVFLPVNPWCSPNCIFHPFLRAQCVVLPLSLIPDEGVNVPVIFWLFLFCRRTLFIKSIGVNVSGRVNCLITRLISIWPSLIWALMGLCCLGFVWTCVGLCLWCTVRASFSCLIVAGKKTWLSASISLSVSIGYWIMFVRFLYFWHLTFAVIKHSVNF